MTVFDPEHLATFQLTGSNTNGVTDSCSELHVFRVDSLFPTRRRQSTQ